MTDAELRDRLTQVVAEADDKHESWHGRTWAGAIADALLAHFNITPKEPTP